MTSRFSNPTKILAATFALLVLAAAVPAAARPAPRAIWIWEADSFRLLDDAVFRVSVTRFLQRRRITTAYLYADAYRGRNPLVAEPEKYRRLLAELHGEGIAVYALLGSLDLKTQEYILPEKRDTAVRMFTSVLAFNAGGGPRSRFDGINIDIEPYLLDDWAANRAVRGAQYLALAAEYMRLKREAGATLAVGPAMPFWFDGIEEVTWEGRRRPLNQFVQEIYDYVAIMDYRNFAAGRDGIIAHAADELAYADARGRQVVIGVETLNTHPRKVTFHGLGRSYLEAQLAEAARAFAAHPSFAGFAIHHLASYRALSR